MEMFYTILNSITKEMLVLAVAVLAVLMLILFIIVCANAHKLRKFNRHAAGGNLSEALKTYYEKLARSEEDIKAQRVAVEAIQHQGESALQKVGLVRYSALDSGSDLSYSLALLNQRNDGFILTGIYGRDYSTSYLKPVTGGTSAIVLSEEEEKALALAQENYQKGGERHE